MRMGKIVASAAMATAAIAVTVVPASAAGQTFQAPEQIHATKVTAPSTVEFSYRCKPGAKREINVGLSAPEIHPTTDFNMWLRGKQVVCNNKTQHVKMVLTESYTGKLRKLKSGEQARTWLAIYGGGYVRETRKMTAH